MTVIFSVKSFFVVKFTLLISYRVVDIIRQNTNGGGQEPNVQWSTTFRTIKSRCCPSRPATQTAVRWDQQSRIASQRGTKTSVGSHARWEFPGPQTGFGPKGVLLLNVNWRHRNSAQLSSQAGPGPRPTMCWPMGWMAAARSKGPRGSPCCNPVENSRVKERNRKQSRYLTIPGKTDQIT